MREFVPARSQSDRREAANMQGVIYKSIEDMVVAGHGAETWAAILKRAGVQDPAFVGMSRYPDELAGRIVGAASAILGAAPEDIMRAFGRHWTTHTAPTYYGDLMAFAGNSFLEVVKNLDQMHARISLIFPNYKPPSFRVEELGAGKLRLHYSSERAGLGPVVEGMMIGLGDRFGVDVQIKPERSRNDGHDHDEFVVTYAPRKS
jgi:hypothetical protein